MSVEGDPAEPEVTQRCRVYEQETVRTAVGDAIRPGGLALTQAALTACALPAGARILDIGCGLGPTVAYCREQGFAAVGLDASALLLQKARERAASLPFIGALGQRLPFADATMDALFAECSLSLLGEVARAVVEFRRVLRPGGLLVVSDLYARLPEGIPLLRQLPLACCLSGALSPQELAETLAAQNFDLLLWEDHSEALRTFTARLIFSHGSLDQFWQCTTHGSISNGAVQEAIACSKPGYLLVVARNAGSAER